MEEGTIEYLSDKGFGFIKPDNGSRRAEKVRNVYFHASSLKHAGEAFENLSIGERVYFTHIVRTARGRMARIVSLEDLILS